jgi:hypothetical protein
MPKNAKHQPSDIPDGMNIRIRAIQKDPIDLAWLAKAVIQIADSMSLEELKELVAEAERQSAEDLDKAA